MMKRTRSVKTCLARATSGALMLSMMTSLLPPMTAHAAGLEDLTTAQRTELASLLKQARAAYSQGDFDAALGHYERANELLDEPEITYQIALCHDKAEHIEDAYKSYKTYLARAPQTKRRGQVEARVAILADRLEANKTGSLEVVTTPPDAMILLAGERVTPDDARFINIPAGQTLTLELRASGYKAHEVTVTIEPGKTHRLELTLQKDSTQTAPLPHITSKSPPEEKTPRATPWWGIAGVAGAGAVATGLSSIMIQRGVARGREDCVSVCDIAPVAGESMRGTLDTKQKRANALGAAAWALVALGSTSAIIAVTRRVSEGEPVTTSAGISPRGVVLELTW